MYILPDFVRNIIKRLEENGHEAYIVGGSVRDLILGKTPADFDVTTSALPDEICAIFDKTIKTGIKHGTVTVVSDKNNVEVTTFRNDGDYNNHRSPEQVSFVSDIKFDLSRRDFTINAMAYNEKSGLLDLFGGKSDLADGVIRAVGNADERFCEDALRILRAVRFASRFNFKIEKSTIDGIIKNIHLLKFISAERIFSELIQILCSDYPEKIDLICRSGGFEFLGIKSIKTPELIGKVNKSRELRFYLFSKLCDVSPLDLCKLLKTDNELKKYCENLLFAEEVSLDPDKADLKLMLRRLSKTDIADYLNYLEIYKNTNTQNAQKELNEIFKNNEAYLIKHLAINGNSLIELGYKNNDIGVILEKLLLAVIKDNSLNTKEKLLELAKNK